MGITSAIVSCSLAYSVAVSTKISTAMEVFSGKISTRIVMANKADDTSQLVRSNVAHYWGWAKRNLKDYDYAKYTSHEGIVTGDPHLGNFIILPMKDSSGRTKLKYTNADLDDAGRGSYAVDFARLAVAVKAITTDIKYKDIVESYVLGLEQKKMEIPEALSEILDEYGIKEYRDALREYVDERVEDGKFIHEEGKIESYRGSLKRSEIQDLFPNGKVLDLAKRPLERGGSKDNERIWVLVEEKGHNTIYELKQWSLTRLSAWSPQKNLDQWLKETTSVFDPQGNGQNFRIEKLSNGKIYWVREKKFTLIDIPYSADSVSEINFINDLATYAAYQLGRWHGQQTGSGKYVKAVNEDQDAFREALKEFVKDYLEEIE
jgi:hypothetical protein